MLDTNVVLALWHYRHPRLLGLLAWLDARSAVLLTRETCMEELARVLSLGDLAIEPTRRGEILAEYRARSVLVDEPGAEGVEAARALPRCRDGDDQKFLELAWETGAHLLLTRDKRVLSMAGRAPWRGRTEIVTPERVLRHIDGSAMEGQPRKIGTPTMG